MRVMSRHLEALFDELVRYSGNRDLVELAVRQVLEQKDDLTHFAERYRLSPRETALLRYALEGMNNDQAAGALGCSRPTISTSWNRIFRKTGVSGQRDLVILFMHSAHASGPLPALRAEAPP
jgi:DNA-binding CsgD family transcriptional regulator